MSEQVHRANWKPTAAFRRSFSPHPLFENFGERVARPKRVRLGLDPAVGYALLA